MASSSLSSSASTYPRRRSLSSGTPASSSISSSLLLNSSSSSSLGKQGGVKWAEQLVQSQPSSRASSSPIRRSSEPLDSKSSKHADSIDKSRVRVFARVRPFTKRESEVHEKALLEVHKTPQPRVVLRDEFEGRIFHYPFDGCFAPEDGQNAVFEQVGRPIIDNVLQGYNATIMAYGQTGSGKTYTMFNGGDSEHSEEDGLVYRSVAELFQAIDLDSNEENRYLVTASFLQIYNEQIEDLLTESPLPSNPFQAAQAAAASRLQLRENPTSGIYVEGLSTFVVRSATDVHQLMKIGRHRLAFAETKLNWHSSRSHAVLQLEVQKTSTRSLSSPSSSSSPTTPSSDDPNQSFSSPPRPSAMMSSPHASSSSSPSPMMSPSTPERIRPPDAKGEGAFGRVIRAKLTIVDLAGSERVKRSGAAGAQFTEAKFINSSLHHLALVVHSLAEKNRQHVPYRSSTLTRLLQPSLSGNALSSVIVCISPAESEFSETWSSLRFGERCMCVSISPIINSEIDHKALCELLKEEHKTRESKLMQAISERDDRIEQMHAAAEQLKDSFASVFSYVRESVSRLESSGSAANASVEEVARQWEEENRRLTAESALLRRRNRHLEEMLRSFVARRGCKSPAVLMAESLSTQLLAANAALSSSSSSSSSHVLSDSILNAAIQTSVSMVDALNILLLFSSSSSSSPGAQSPPSSPSSSSSGVIIPLSSSPPAIQEAVTKLQHLRNQVISQTLSKLQPLIVSLPERAASSSSLQETVQHLLQHFMSSNSKFSPHPASPSPAVSEEKTKKSSSASVVSPRSNAVMNDSELKAFEEMAIATDSILIESILAHCVVMLTSLHTQHLALQEAESKKLAQTQALKLLQSKPPKTRSNSVLKAPDPFSLPVPSQLPPPLSAMASLQPSPPPSQSPLLVPSLSSLFPPPPPLPPVLDVPSAIPTIPPPLSSLSSETLSPSPPPPPVPEAPLPTPPAVLSSIEVEIIQQPSQQVEEREQIQEAAAAAAVPSQPQPQAVAAIDPFKLPQKPLTAPVSAPQKSSPSTAPIDAEIQVTPKCKCVIQ